MKQKERSSQRKTRSEKDLGGWAQLRLVGKRLSRPEKQIHDITMSPTILSGNTLVKIPLKNFGTTKLKVSFLFIFSLNSWVWIWDLLSLGIVVPQCLCILCFICCDAFLSCIDSQTLCASSTEVIYRM